ncbi:MAG: sugar ABC transporter permease [Lachnospiraceae bacterium]|nr:sugar ABC transporter permease [Lachnospiraceae bacterium]MBR5357469.1 sugar ABC transporter permease [Lachnospiraceae bacterium]
MKKNTKWVVLFLLPGVLLFSFILLSSLFVLTGSSFTDWFIGSKITFVGLKNYIYLFTKDKVFLESIKNTLIWIGLQSTIHVTIGVIVALLLSKKKWYSSAVRTIFFIPNIISSAALGMLFLCVMNPQFGLINGLVSRITGDRFVQNWYNDPKTAFLSVTLTWLPYAGLVTILVMAEMSAISEELFEAAKIDGATSFQIDMQIILPLMKNIIGTCVVLAATSMLQKLDVIMMTTSGGPGSRTMNMPMYIYKTVFSNNNYSLANTQGVILIVLGVVVLKIIRKVFGMDKED